MTTLFLILIAFVILTCIGLNNVSSRIGVPTLLAFLLLGLVFSNNAISPITFHNQEFAKEACTVALIFIMFNGGFNTNWKHARPYVGKAIMLSSVGVFLTAMITMVCCHYLLKLSFQESFLLSAVLASTDAASVFSILKSNNLDLKDGTSSILEVESGSNDPMAYLLTITAISIMSSGKMGNLFLTITAQLVVGLGMGLAFAYISKYTLSKKNIIADGLDVIFILAAVMLCYGVSDRLGGNAYLSVYLMGLLLGNTRMNSKRPIIAFFNELTSLLQILIFFIIGLLSFPHSMPKTMPLAFAVVAILTFVARPLMTIVLLMPLKCSLRQCLLIAWAGLRGASSIVFAIVAVSSGIHLSFDIFHVVFLVSLFSIAIQGALLPTMSKKLDMIEKNANIMKTFNDYEESIDFQFAKLHIEKDNEWVGKRIDKIDVPLGSQAIMIRRNGKSLAARGKSLIKANDDLILNVPAYYPSGTEEVSEVSVYKGHKWANKTVAELNLPVSQLIIMVIRNGKKFIPNGDTLIKEDDVLLIFNGEEQENAQ